VKERLTKISLQAFRGVLDAYEIKLDQGQSLLMYGDNGTGKSSLADAIEWYFTGDIELLAKEGRDHAVRHLGAAKKQKTLVSIATNGELGGTCAPKSPNKMAIEAASRETFLLRGRTIADFVDKSKGEKWSALQRLLGLGAIDELRTDLQKARSELKRKRDDATATVKQAAAGVVAQKVEPEKIDAALAKLAKSCGFEAQDTIDDYLKLDLISLITPAKSSMSSRGAVTAALVAELDAAEIEIDTKALAAWNETIDGDVGDPTQVDVLAAASRYVEAHPEMKQCPVCDKKVPADSLKTKLTATLAVLEEQSERFSSAESAAENAADALVQLQKDRMRWRTKAKEIGVELPAIPDGAKTVKSAIAERRSTDVTATTAFIDSLAAWDKNARTQLAKQSAAEPEAPSARNHAIEFGQLLVAAKQWKDAFADEQRATKAYERADAVFEICQAEQKKYVTSVLEQISAEVARLFERLHPDTGKIGSVAVETWGDKGIELAVDFYGQRQRPLHGVLSESYMNSVAIVLFLAMARTFNERLNFLVLDDVVNSFDVTPRGRLGELLIEEFEDWQLVVLTHDRYFFEQVRRRVKGWSAYQVLGWSYERGPSLREQRGATDVDAALELLEAGAIGDAARRGRRGLEHVLKELCEGLEVPLPYRRGNENEFREIGQLLNGLRRLLKDDSRGKAFLASIDGTLRSLEADATAVLNAEAHASDAGPSAGEVRSTLERVRAFDALWTCTKCNTRIWKESGVRCRCGASPFPPSVAAK
jgi:energy-coupling factor transporter ATP-binding protein EcfA2